MAVVPNKAPTVYMAWQASSTTMPNNVLPKSVCSADGTVVAFASAGSLGAGSVPGIFYSTNGGRTFIQTPTKASNTATDFAMNRLAITADGTTIYAVSNGNGIFKYIIGSGWVTTLPSTVSGGAALKLGNNTDNGLTSVACSADGTKIFVCSTLNVLDPAGVGRIYYSTNGGGDWLTYGTGIYFVDICCSSNGTYVFAVARPASSLVANIYYSGNAGTNFGTITTTPFIENELAGVACSTNGNVVMCAGKNIYLSVNGTAVTPSFTINNPFSSGGTAAWQTATVSQDGSKLYVVADGASSPYLGGLYYSLNQGSTWRYDVPGGSPAGVAITGARSLTLRSDGYPGTIMSTAQFTGVNGFWYSTITVLCFKEGTKILCFVDGKETYLPVETLKPGSFVKTYLHGYKAIESIGSSKIYNPANTLRGKNRLYVCKKEKYPEVTEDLVITGCHSILVDSIDKKQEDDIRELAGDIYVTDKKYRLMACLDDRAETYSEEGVHNIWHFALANKDYYMNYGVYANGLLVESTSRRMMKELSGMELV